MRTACQFSRSWSSRVSMQVKPRLAAALSYLGKQHRRRGLCQPTQGPRLRPLDTTSGTTPFPASTHHCSRPRRPAGSQPPRSHLSSQRRTPPPSGTPEPSNRPPRPAASWRARSAPRRNGCAPGSGGGAGSRGRRRPLAPRARTTCSPHLRPPLPLRAVPVHELGVLTCGWGPTGPGRRLLRRATEGQRLNQELIAGETELSRSEKAQVRDTLKVDERPKRLKFRGYHSVHECLHSSPYAEAFSRFSR